MPDNIDPEAAQPTITPAPISDATPKKPHKPYNRAYNRSRVRQLADAGVPTALIARDQDVVISTIQRYLDKCNIQVPAIKRFNANKADILSMSQLTNHTIEDIIKHNWLQNPEDTLLSLPIKEQKDIIHTMQGGRYYDHQSERLERGMSTVNQASVIADIAAIKEGLDKV